MGQLLLVIDGDIVAIAVAFGVGVARAGGVSEGGNAEVNGNGLGVRTRTALTHIRRSAETVTHMEAPRFYLPPLTPPAELSMSCVPGDGNTATNGEGLAKVGGDCHCHCRLI